MIELIDDSLSISFPDEHPEASMRITLHRTLRLPDDGTTYPLPSGLGRFPIEHVDDHAQRLPESWRRRGGVMLPMWQSEALWIEFEANWVAERGAYPFAVKVAAGKICAVSGEPWIDEMTIEPQSYMVVPDQHWLDGFHVGDTVVRQFVAVPLGSGLSAEEQLTGRAEHGGLQIMVRPMAAAEFERRVPIRKPTPSPARDTSAEGDVVDTGGQRLSITRVNEPTITLGLGPGGKTRESIASDKHGLEAWSPDHASRCFVHLANSETWREITGKKPPTQPITAQAYSKAGWPWFAQYADRGADLPITERLKRLVGIGGGTRVDVDSTDLRHGLSRHQVRELASAGDQAAEDEP